jgi:hypothetical protein
MENDQNPIYTERPNCENGKESATDSPAETQEVNRFADKLAQKAGNTVKKFDSDQERPFTK